jgi:hypothetical protein
MRGFRWGFWDYPGGNWTYPRNRGSLFFLPYAPYPQGTCATYEALDQTILEDLDVAQSTMLGILGDARIPPRDRQNIRADSQDFIVTLSGQVENPDSKVFAYLDAFNVAGVKDVINKIELSY